MKRSEEVQSLTKFNTEDFNFMDTFHDLVGNRGFGEGYYRENEREKHYIWEVLSAIGNGIGNVMYSNVLHYGDLVANVDTCKTKQLQSFLDLFGMGMKILNTSDGVPVEVMNMIDTLSISRKYLFRNPIVSEELKKAMDEFRTAQDNKSITQREELDVRWYYENIPNNFRIERTNCQLESTQRTDGSLIYGEYSPTYDFAYEMSDIVSGEYVVCRTYTNENGVVLAKIAKSQDKNTKNRYVLSANDLFIGEVQVDQLENTINVSEGHRSGQFYIQDDFFFPENGKDPEFIRRNIDNSIKITYVPNDAVSVDNRTYGDDEFYEFVKYSISDLIYHFVSLPYNTRLVAGTTTLSAKPIYSYQKFWAEYHVDDQMYQQLDDQDDMITQLKRAYNIDSSFDQESIVDAIENGEDDLGNYGVNEQMILSAEMDQRKANLDFTELKYNISEIQGLDGKNTSYEPYTRYSYYRYKKVKEYVDFVENFMFADSDQLANREYSYDTNYFIKRSTDKKSLFTRSGSSIILDTDLIYNVSEQITNIIRYLCKLREKLKIQIRKNYSKGTANLLRYVVNEYVQDFSKNCGYLKDPDNDYPDVQGLNDVLKNLSAHSINNVEVVEYVDTTEYFNIENENTPKSITKASYNSDYFTEYFSYDKNSGKVVETKEPYELDLGEIRNFYISSLALDQVLDDEDELNSFLSVIFDIGKSKRYVDSELSIMVCQLSDGRSSKDMYIKNSNVLSCLDMIERYLEGSGYEFTETLLSDQIDDILSSVIYQGLSDQYLSNCSELYDKYIDQIQDHNTSVQSLLDDYETVLTGEYAYYFTKSDLRYCYTDNDPDNGTYKHDYLYDNQNYKETYLYEKLTTLRSYATESNLRNFSMIDSAEYFENEFGSIYYQYTQTILPDLVSYGYVESSSEDFSEKLKNAKSFAENQKQTFTSSAQDTWSGFKATLKEIQTSYSTLNATVASLKSRYDKDDLNKIYCVTDSSVSKKQYEEYTWNVELGEGPEQCCRMADSSPKKYVWCQEREIGGKKKYFYRTQEDDDKGTVRSDSVKYPYWIQEAGEYDSSGSISTRIDWLLNVVGAITYAKLNIKDDEQVIEFSEGPKRVGSVEEVQSAQTELVRIQSQCDNLKQQMDAAGCDYDDDGTVIESDIKSLESYLGTHDYTQIIGTNDRIQKLINYISLIDTYSSSYTTMQSDFKSLKQQTGIADYIGDTKIGDYLNMTSIQNLAACAETKDAQQYSVVQNSIDDLFKQYDTLLASVQNLIYNIRQDVKALYTDDSFAETLLSAAQTSLENDRDTKYEEGMYVISQQKKRAVSDFNKVETYLSGYPTSTEPLTAVLNEIAEDNDINSNGDYQKALNEFRTYTNTTGSYQGYYNRKNITHSTRQVHPFMWNFIKYVADSNNTDKVFYSYQVSELESSKSEQYIDKIVGKYGNLQDVWKYSLQDFTGYTTRYIANDNVTDKNTQIFEVAEYDGAFYPPAIEQYRKDYRRCLKSLSEQVKVGSICNAISLSDTISYYLSSHISADPITTLESILYNKTVSCFQDYLVDNNLCSVVHDFVDGIETVVLSDEITGEEKITTTAKKQDFIDYLNDNINKTFYERFYANLELTKDNIDFIVSQLSNKNIRNRIYEITDDQTKANIYDIHDYALDFQNNVYVLYKNYGNAHPTYKQKLNTPGQVWARLNNHPIAFPLVSENNEDKDLSQIKINTDTNTYLKDTIYEEGITRDYCYQMQLSYNKKILALVCKKTRIETGVEELDPLFDGKYEYASVVMSEIDTEVDDTRNFTRLVLTNNDGAFDDIITGVNKKYFDVSELSAAGTHHDVYSLIGMYSPSGYKMNLLYVEKRLEYADKDSVYRYIRSNSPEIAQLEFDSNKQGLDEGTAVTTIDPKPSDDPYLTGLNHQLISDVVFAYNRTENLLTFCFIRNLMGTNPESLERKAKPWYSDYEIDVIEGTEGGTFDDKISKQMNSFDLFVQNICTMTTNTKLDKISYTEHNVNADMSFIPIYPSKTTEFQVKDKNKQYSCYNIELLGKSKNIDSHIDNTNPSPDPNFDIDTITKNRKFGRVYEDYLDEYDKTFIVAENESLNSNMDQYCQKSGGNVDNFVWKFDLEHETGKTFPDSSIEDFKIIIFNKSTLGKNPYFFGDLTALVGGKRADYTSYLDDQGSNERTYEDDTLLEGQKITVVGQNPVSGKVSSIDDNTIYNISGIKFDFDRKTKTLTTTFEKNDPNIDSSVNKNTVRYLFFNTKDITVFEYYHLLDQYGLINVRYGEIDASGHGSVSHDGWKFVYDTSRYSKEYLESMTRSFYSQNLRNMDLGDVHLSDYDCLSDVYVLQDYNHLAFKYSSEDIFHISTQNYYFPTLNVKYPYTTGQLVYEQVNNIDPGTVSDGQSKTDIFGNSEVYIIDFDENKTLIDEIGYVDIPRMYKYDDCVIAFEDYLDASEDQRLDYHDARVLRHLKFNSLDSSTMCLSDEIDTDELGITTTGRTTEDVLEQLAKLNEGKDELFILSSEHGGSTSATRYVRVNLSEHNGEDRKVSIEGLTNLNVNYKREDDFSGITLYFNYNNYLNSPFIKIDEDYNVLVDTIDNTYLKLKSGESGYLDIVIQVKYSEQGRLVGYTNLNLIRYQIFNISDDKPKFVIRAVNKIQRDNYKQDDSLMRTCDVGVADILLTQSQLIPYEKDKYQTDIVVRFDSGNSTLKSVDFYLFFPSQIFSFDTTRSSHKCNVSYAGEGCVHVTSDLSPDRITVPIITVSPAFDLLINNTDIYELFVDEVNCYDSDGNKLFANTSGGVFRVTDAGSNVNTVLVNEQGLGHSPAGDGQSNKADERQIITETGRKPILTRRFA